MHLKANEIFGGSITQPETRFIVVLHGIHMDVTTIASCGTGSDLMRVKHDHVPHDLY